MAAPQVNRGLRLITVDLTAGEKKNQLFILINPVILDKDGEDVSEEACLSVPGVQEKVNRPFRVILKGLNLQGQEKIIEAEGLLARVFCHEIDHLNGILFIDHLSPLKRSLLRKKLKKELIDNENRFSG